MNYLVASLFALASFYILLVTVVFLFQRNLLYHSSVNNYSEGVVLERSIGIEKVRIKTDDNIQLLGWFYNNNIEKFKTILLLHGNAGSLENRIYKLNNFKNLNVNFLIVAWRGFSGNKGNPTEAGLYIDARSAIKWLNSKGVAEQNIILYGESLGTGVAVEIAQNKNYAGVILESPYTSMVHVGKKHYPFFPVKLLLKDKFESYKKINKVLIPILIMHGKLDSIVPFSMGNKMYELANEPKFFYVQEYGDHMMDYDEKLLNSLKKFVQSLN